MRAQTKRKLAVGTLRGGAYAATAALPITVLAANFPMVVEKTSESTSLSVSAVLAGIIMLVTFRAQVWKKVKEKLGINSFGILIAWGLVYLFMMGIERLYPIVAEVQAVCVAGLVGTGCGQVMSTAAVFIESKQGTEEKTDSENKRLSEKGEVTDVV